MLEVIATPAADLVSLETAKTYLGVEGTDDDAVLSSLITRASAAIVSYLGFNPNAGEYRETVETLAGQQYILLSRTPVTSISSVSVNSAALSSDTYRLDSASGLLARLSGGRYRAWESRSAVVVEYNAGYAEVPADLQQACLTLVNAAWAERGKDPALRSISIGSINLGYFGGDNLPGINSVAPLLDTYRAVGIG